jgi:hypothetical protein
MSEIESVDYLDKQVELAKAMKRLQSNADFQMIFDDKFIKDWAITQTYNMSVYNQQSRVGVVENMVARSIFSQFCDQIIEDGMIAVDTLQQIKEEEESTVE